VEEVDEAQLRLKQVYDRIHPLVIKVEEVDEAQLRLKRHGHHIYNIIMSRWKRWMRLS